MFNLAICLNWTPIFEWCVVRCESKNKHQEVMCLIEIALHAQSLLVILGLIANMIGGTYMIN